MTRRIIDLKTGQETLDPGFVPDPYVPTAEELAQAAETAAVDAETTAAKADAWVTAFLAMTPDDARQFILNNTASLADARTHLARLAYVVRVLVRREFGR